MGGSVQNTQINNSTRACSYVNVCPMEGKLAVGRAMGGGVRSAEVAQHWPAVYKDTAVTGERTILVSPPPLNRYALTMDFWGFFV